MRNKNKSNKMPVTILTGDIIEPSPARRNFDTLLSTRPMSTMLQEAMLQVGNDHCRALMAQTAIEHAKLLAVMIRRQNNIALHSSQYYQSVLVVYGICLTLFFTFLLVWTLTTPCSAKLIMRTDTERMQILLELTLGIIKLLSTYFVIITTAFSITP